MRPIKSDQTGEKTIFVFSRYLYFSSYSRNDHRMIQVIVRLKTSGREWLGVVVVSVSFVLALEREAVTIARTSIPTGT